MRMRQVAGLVFLLVVVAPAWAQGRGGTAMKVTSSAFAPWMHIPEQYTCKGEDLSPALEWSGAPANAASFAVIMDDPDAPRGTWVHWVMWNIPASAPRLSQGVLKQDQLSDGARQGRNSDGNVGYNGPCPPMGQTHRYFFRVYALDTKLELEAGAERSQLDAAMKGHVLAQGEYVGKFHK